MPSHFFETTYRNFDAGRLFKPANRISSARITLNGIQLFSPRDFNQHAANLSADIVLHGENTLKVELRSNSHSHHTPGFHKKPFTHADAFKRIFRWMCHAPARLWAWCGFGPHPTEPHWPHLTITVVQDVPAPTAGISVAPQAIVSGQSAELTWSSTHAETCAIEPGIGKVDLNGSLTVSPTAPTTYTLTAESEAGTATTRVELMVYYPPAATISVSPEALISGESATFPGWRLLKPP